MSNDESLELSVEIVTGFSAETQKPLVLGEVAVLRYVVAEVVV